jgi:putative peptidoglycan binding protein
MAAGKAQTKLDNRGNEIKAEAEQARALAAQATVAGDEDFDGASAVRIDLPLPPGADPSFVPTNASVLIDKNKFVVLQHRVEGVAAVDGEPQDVFIETAYLDFRDVPGTKLYEPYKRVMRMGGMLNDEQMAQMEEARIQLEEFDRQMAEMPAAQREMMENMLGSQMDIVRNMANGGGMFEYTEIVEEILINPDLVALFNPDYGSTKSILEQIQELLIALDYSPGNTDGVLDDLTMVAISQFQAENGLEVTGQPGTALLNKLMAEAGK